MEAITHLQPYSEHDYNKVARERLKTHPLEEQSLRGFQSVLNAIQQKSHNRYCCTCNTIKKKQTLDYIRVICSYQFFHYRQ